MPSYSKEEIAVATSVNLQDFLQSKGYELKKADGLSKKLEGYGGLYIFEKGFHHFSEDKSGNNIHFCRDYLGMGFQEAVKELHNFVGYVPTVEYNFASQYSNYRKENTAKPKPLPTAPAKKTAPQFQNPPVEQYQPPQQFREQAPPIPQYQEPPEAFGEPPPEFFGEPPPEFWGEPPPEAFGEPPNFYDQAPPQQYDQAPPQQYNQVPPQQYNQAPPPQVPPPAIPEYDGNLPPDFMGELPQLDEEDFGEVAFELPSINEHETMGKLHPPTFQKQEDREEMVLPPKSNDQSGYKSFLYLTNDRGLDKDIVNDLMKKGQIFEATTQSGEYTFKNVAFVGTDKEGTAKYCALRGVGKSSFRQDVKNSDKNFGFCMKGRSNRVFVCEAPIDVISHATLTKMNGVDHTADSRISTGGLSDGALKQFLEDNPQITTIVFAFDNDKDVVDKQGKPTNYGQNYAEKCKRTYAEQGYTTMVQTPKGKDFNEDLVQKLKPSVKQQLSQLKQNTQPRSAPPVPSKNKGER